MGRNGRTAACKERRSVDRRGRTAAKRVSLERPRSPIEQSANRFLQPLERRLRRRGARHDDDICSRRHCTGGCAARLSHPPLHPVPPHGAAQPPRHGNAQPGHIQAVGPYVDHQQIIGDACALAVSQAKLRGSRQPDVGRGRRIRSRRGAAPWPCAASARFARRACASAAGTRGSFAAGEPSVDRGASYGPNYSTAPKCRHGEVRASRGCAARCG